MGRMTLMTGDERRRRWSDEERARILAAIEEPGAVVAAHAAQLPLEQWMKRVRDTHKLLICGGRGCTSA